MRFGMKEPRTVTVGSPLSGLAESGDIGCRACDFAPTQARERQAAQAASGDRTVFPMAFGHLGFGVK